MEDMRELSAKELDNVVGGVCRTVNTGVQGLNAALRAEPCKSSRQIGSISNGTIVDIYTDELKYDPVSHRSFVKIWCNGKTGWVFSSLVGLPR